MNKAQFGFLFSDANPSFLKLGILGGRLETTSLASEIRIKLRSVADHEVDPWVFSRRGKLGRLLGRLLGGHGGITPNFSEIVRKLVKVGHAARAMARGLFCDLFFISNSILLLLVVGQVVKTHPPFPLKVSWHISARRQLKSFGNVVQKTMGGGLLGGSLFAGRPVRV